MPQTVEKRRPPPQTPILAALLRNLAPDKRPALIGELTSIGVYAVENALSRVEVPIFLRGAIRGATDQALKTAKEELDRALTDLLARLGLS